MCLKITLLSLIQLVISEFVYEILNFIEQSFKLFPFVNAKTALDPDEGWFVKFCDTGITVSKP